MTPENPPDEYDGPALITTPSGPVEVEVALRSHFEPIDGHTHWFARIAANDDLAKHCSSGETVTLAVEGASADGRLSDIDPWGRFRIGGTGPAPIPAPAP